MKNDDTEIIIQITRGDIREVLEAFYMEDVTELLVEEAVGRLQKYSLDWPDVAVG